MTGYCTKEQIAQWARTVVLPPAKPMSHLDYCGTLMIPDGPLRGTRYQPSADPVHAVIAREINSGIWQRIIGVGAVQTGKSLALILVPLLRNLTLLRQPVVYSQPTLTKLHEAWAGKLRPSIEDSGYGHWLPDRGQGAKGSQTPKFIVYRDPKSNARAGTMYLIPGGGASESAQAAVTAAVVCVDEVDSFPDRHRVELVTKRADSYGPHGLRIYTSTVKRDGDTGDEASVILALYNESTASRLWFQCPHCNHWQPLEWERVSYQDDNEPQAIASVRYACAGCAVAWTEDDRQRALRSYRLVHAGQTVDQATGTVIGTPPETVAFGLLWTALDSSLRSLGQVAAEHWRAERALANGDHGPMRSFWRDQLCRRYTGDSLTDEDGGAVHVTRSRLAALSEASQIKMAFERKDEDGDSIHTAEVPAWVEHITVGVDVQRGGERAPGRLYYLALGRGGARSAIVGFGTVACSAIGQQPTTEELYAGLDRLDGMLTEWSPNRPITRKGVDVGDRQDELVRWLKSHPRWWAVKGSRELNVSEPGDLAGWVYRRPQEGQWLLWLIAGESVRRQAQAELMGETGKPGSCALPHGLTRNDAIIRHLCGSIEYEPGKWSSSPRDKMRHPEWNRRIDYLDCYTYARALAYQYEHSANKPRRVKYGAIGDVR